MKTHSGFLLAILCSFAWITANATVRTVSNNASNPAQFTTFAAAQTASVNGDTIYILGSPFQYPAISITKRLVIIGAGYGPNNQFGQPTFITSCDLFRDTGPNNPSNSVITGILTNSISMSGTVATNNVRLFRNRIIGSITLTNPGYADGWIIFNNIIGTVNGGAGGRTTSSATNVVFANNIFTSGLALNGFNSNTILVDHNLFLSANSLYYVFNIIVTNNLFTRSSGTLFYDQVVLCTFNNNLTNQNTIGAAAAYSPTNSFTATFLTAPGGANSGGGNIVGSDPLFVSASNFDTYTTTFNYRLQAGSPGRNAGTDLTDLGIYGGTYPFPSGGVAGSGYDTSPMPPIPQVTSVNIQNATIQPNGTLNVQVQGRVNN